jgi:hypothetical protein
LCVQQLHGQYKHVIVHEVLNIQLLYTQVWFMDYRVLVLTIQLLYTQV